MIATTTTPPRAMTGRVAFATLAALLLASIAVAAIGHSTGYWQIAAFGFAPDLALFNGAGRGLAHGQIHPRAVGPYNTVHRFWGPFALAAVAALGVLSVAFFIGALTWAFHNALDRGSATDFGLAMATSVPDQLTPRAREIVNAARELLEEEGIEALSMRRVGQVWASGALDLQAPSRQRGARGRDHLDRI